MCCKPLISVIIPIYNAENYLAECLDAILSNTYGNLEILCIDDESTDLSLNILRDYAAKDPRIIVMLQKNKGCAGARNTGLRKASGDFIAFIDADDIIHSQYFELLLYFQKKFGSDITTCGHTVDPNGLAAAIDYPDDLPAHENAYQRYVDNIDSSGFSWGRLFSRTAIQGIYYRKMAIEDCPFLTDTLLKNPVSRCSYIDVPLYFYRQYDGSASRRFSSKDYYDIARFYHHAIKRTSDSYFQARLIHESIRNLFSWCLHKTLEEPARKNVIYHHLRRLFTKRCLRQLIGCSNISLKYKLIYTCLACCPSVYCKYRIWRDPSSGNL